VRRHYPDPHEFVCVTDDPKGLERSIRVVPLWSDFRKLTNPTGSHNPNCYPRLKLFSHEARELIGERFVCIDIDMVLTGDLRPLWNRPEEFVIWGGSGKWGQTFYNGSMWMMTAGSRARVWETFRPVASPAAAMRGGHRGSDQGWISYCLGNAEAIWTKADGVYSYRVDLKSKAYRLPEDARVVAFHGKVSPWDAEAQRQEWVRRNWR
jgi:hypothetical protein